MSLKDLFIYKSDRVYKDFTIAPPKREDYNNKVNSYIKTEIKDKETILYKEGKVSEKIAENLEFIKDAFCTERNFDVVIREFSIPCVKGERKGFLCFYDGMSNKEFINRDILGALLKNAQCLKEREIDEKMVYESLISQAALSKTDEMRQVLEFMAFGNCGIFVDGIGVAFVADVKGWSGRGVDKPVTEAVLTGPQEAFTEQVMTNISLVRKILKDPNLMSENIQIGSKSKTPCALMYLNGLTNSSLVEEVRRRLSGIGTEYIFSSSQVEMFIEESALFPLPQVLKTERPDRVASYLAEGKVAIIVQGSPFALVLPATMPDLIEATEDNYVRTIEANFMRVVRIFGILISLLLPGTFVAISLYHHESIPTDLLFAIEATREVVPFPVVTELLLMELSFELIKEASIRIPSPIGATIGIVGGLILGQAAVSANLVSPILIIVVSVAGLGAFAIPSVSLSRAISFMRFVFIVLGAFAGFLGLALGLVVSLSALSSRTSVGVPYLAPITPRGKQGMRRAVFVPPLWKREKRASFLKAKREYMQPQTSRKWAEEREVE